jgi:hypothetical protein
VSFGVPAYPSNRLISNVLVYNDDTAGPGVTRGSCSQRQRQSYRMRGSLDIEYVAMVVPARNAWRAADWRVAGTDSRRAALFHALIGTGCTDSVHADSRKDRPDGSRSLAVLLRAKIELAMTQAQIVSVPLLAARLQGLGADLRVLEGKLEANTPRNA